MAKISLFRNLQINYFKYGLQSFMLFSDSIREVSTHGIGTRIAQTNGNDIRARSREQTKNQIR